MSSTRPLVTCFWDSYFCAVLDFLRLEPLSSRFSFSVCITYATFLFLLYILDVADKESDFKEGLCFSSILKPDQCVLWFNPLKVSHKTTLCEIPFHLHTHVKVSLLCC